MQVVANYDHIIGGHKSVLKKDVASYTKNIGGHNLVCVCL